VPFFKLNIIELLKKNSKNEIINLLIKKNPRLLCLNLKSLFVLSSNKDVFRKRFLMVIGLILVLVFFHKKPAGKIF